jgi:transposase
MPHNADRHHGSSPVVTLGELVMILDLARQGLTVSAIARRTGHDRKTIRKYLATGMEPPTYKAREPAPSPLAPFEAFLCERVGRFPDLTGRRLWREIRELGFTGGYSTVTDFLRDRRPPAEPPAFERRFETPPGRQVQVDFAFFRVRFEDEPGAERIFGSPVLLLPSIVGVVTAPPLALDLP